MKRFLNSYLTFAAVFAALYVFLLFAVCNIYNSFAYYATYLFGYKFFGISLSTSIIGSLILFFILTSSAWVLIKSDKFCLWKKLKIGFISFSVITAVIFSFIVYLVFNRINLVATVVILPIIAYVFAVLWLTRLLTFLQENEKYKKISWWKFYKQFSIKQPIAISVTLLLVIFIVYFIFEAIDIAEKNIGDLLLFFMASLLHFAVLTALCEYLSRFSEGKAMEFEKVMSDKIKAERFKTELITNVSHDIKTPLTSIINYADLVNTTNLNNDKLKEYTSVIYKKSLRLKALIEDLIEASKAGTGNIVLNSELINLCELTGQILGEFDEQFATKDLQLVSQIPEGEISIIADGRYLWRVLENIFSNALKYSLGGTRIYAELSTKNDTCFFTLKNISKEPLNILADELTEQFVRGDRARLTEGSGLGLYIAKSLTEAMHGRLNLNASADLFEVEISFSIFAKSI